MTPPRTGPRAPAVLLLVGSLLLGTLGLLLGPLGAGRPAPLPGSAIALGALGALVVAASLLVVRFRAGRDVDSVTLVEAVLAPLLLAFAGPEAVAAVVLAAIGTAVARRTDLAKSAFNTAQWGFAVACGSVVVLALGEAAGFTVRGVLAVVAGLLVVWTVNNAAFVTVLSCATGRSVPAVLRGLAPVILPGWVGGFAVNALLGLLYVCAYAATPWSVLLFPVPLLLLHLAYRGYALARSDRRHLAALHRAAQALTGPVDPDDALPQFLTEVARGFGAGSAALLVEEPSGLQVHLAGADGRCSRPGPTALWTSLAARTDPRRLTSTSGPTGRLLAAAGHHSAVCARLPAGGERSGVLVLLDQDGVEGLPDAEDEVLAALARETSATFDKGALLARVLEDRRRLGEIVGSTSDGILTLAPDGSVTSWNPALERLTGLPADEVVGRPQALRGLALRTTDGEPVDLQGWLGAAAAPPEELRLTTPSGERRVLCSYDVAAGTGGEPQTMVVVARDVTPADDLHRLRQDFHRLVEAEAAQRLVLEHLQQAVMPARPVVPGNELGVAYVASDPTSPTGGDLYDCQLLPDGDVHLCVVDVLGHGVEATQAALTVMHTLRTVVLDGTALQDVVARADLLVGRQDPELVATVVLARYSPATGGVQVASGGHPPPLLVRASGDVQQLSAEGGAIGWPGAGSDGVVDAVLGHGDSLLLYTDGLVEARKDLLEGLAELEVHARQVRGLGASALADALVDRVLAGAERRDDTLALVLRRGAAQPGGARRSWLLEPVPGQVTSARREAVQWLRAEGAEDVGVDVDDAALVLGELLANAVEHARSTVHVDLELTDCLRVVVGDDGPGLLREPPSGHDPDAESGRGLQIVSQLSDDYQLDSGPQGTVVSVVLTAPTAVPAQPAASEQGSEGLMGLGGGGRESNPPATVAAAHRL